METLTSQQVSDLTPEQLNGLVAIAVSVGTLYCFLGYRTAKFVIGMTGFLIAGVVASLVVGVLTEGHLISIGVGALIGGASGAMALFFLYRTGVFLLGLLGTTLAAYNVLTERPETWIPFAILGLGVLGGLIALLIERPVVTLATAAIGAWLVVSGVAYFLLGSTFLGDYGETLESNEATVLLVAWGLLACLGVFAQFVTRSRAGAKPAG